MAKLSVQEKSVRQLIYFIVSIYSFPTSEQLPCLHMKKDVIYTFTEYNAQVKQKNWWPEKNSRNRLLPLFFLWKIPTSTVQQNPTIFSTLFQSLCPMPFQSTAKNQQMLKFSDPIESIQCQSSITHFAIENKNRTSSFSISNFHILSSFHTLPDPIRGWQIYTTKAGFFPSGKKRRIRIKHMV